MIEGLFDENNKLGRYFVPEFAFFTRRWGEVDGPAALAFAMKKWPAAASHMAGNVSQMAAGWATQSPQTAVDWLNSRTDALPWIQDAVMAGLVEGLAKRDLEWARKLVECKRHPQPHANRVDLGLWTGVEPVWDAPQLWPMLPWLRGRWRLFAGRPRRRAAGCAVRRVWRRAAG